MQLCPHVIFIRPRFDAYKEASVKIREIFRRYTELIEPFSLDEAFLDVTDDKQNIGSAIEIAAQIKKAIKDELQLTASAGISVNKFVAKIASDINKPDGLTFIGPSRIQNFMEGLPVEKFFGVGKVTAQKMKSMGLHSGADLKKLTEAELTKYFGKAGKFYYQIVRGVDNRSVQPHRESKSVGAEDTFPYDLVNLDEMHEALDKIAGIVYDRLRRLTLKGRTITLKIKYHDFKLLTRSQSFQNRVGDLETIASTARHLLSGVDTEDKKIRLLGISLSNFSEVQLKRNRPDHNDQLNLF
jgi:DNA polymerase-4